MINNRKENALVALQEATRLRRSLGYSIWDPVSIYDCADQLGIEVRFVDIPSLEAIYAKGAPPTILISSLRPSGRQVFSCAHEIGHHIFNHGNHLYQNNPEQYDPKSSRDEFLAQVFAGFFLMPKSAVERAFVTRGWNLQLITPSQVYEISNWFGVGYETLIDHMQYTLKLIKDDYANKLKMTNLHQIRSTLLGEEISENLTVVNSYWTQRAIEIQVGDVVVVPKNTMEDTQKMQFLRNCKLGDLFQAAAPGVGRFYYGNSEWSAYVKISRQGYIGRSIFRHLEEIDYD